MGIQVTLFKLSTHPIQFLRIKFPQPSKMAEDYGNYTPQDFGEYVDDMIGDYSAQLKKKTFTDKTKTSYLEAVKYNADIVWNVYNIKQDVDPTLALVNTDVLDVVLLSLHHKSQVKKRDISDAAKRALTEVLKFQDLILLEDYSEMEAQSWAWVKTATSDKVSKSYPAQMCLMSWFLTLVSKMTGLKVPGMKKLMVGGRIMKEKQEMAMYFTTITTITQAMAEKNHWNFLSQYSILKQMHKDLNNMISKF